LDFIFFVLILYLLKLKTKQKREMKKQLSKELERKIKNRNTFPTKRNPLILINSIRLSQLLFYNIILKQIANKIIKKITKFQIFISILINDYSKLKYLFAFSNHSGGNL